MHTALPTAKSPLGHVHKIFDQFNENLPEFDVLEFYVELVHDLKMRGF